jgi:hypothetical protein
LIGTAAFSIAAAETVKAGLSAKAPAGFVSVTLTIYAANNGAVCATAKLPVTVPVEDIEQAVAGSGANNPDPAVRLRVQLLAEAEVANPPPEILTAPPSVPSGLRVPYPGGTLVGDRVIVGPVTTWNPLISVAAGKAPIGFTVMS